MPTDQELDEMSLRIYHMLFSNTGENYRHRREKVMELCLAAKRNELLTAIRNDTETLAKVAWDKS